MADQVDLGGAGSRPYQLDLRQQLLAAQFVAMGGGEVGDEHVGAGVAQGLLDAVEEIEIADTVETEEAVDQHDRVLGACIPLHKRACIP